jgi:hypothetical protein
MFLKLSHRAYSTEKKRSFKFNSLSIFCSQLRRPVVKSETCGEKVAVFISRVKKPS